MMILNCFDHSLYLNFILWKFWIFIQTKQNYLTLQLSNISKWYLNYIYFENSKLIKNDIVNYSNLYSKLEREIEKYSKLKSIYVETFS